MFFFQPNAFSKRTLAIAFILIFLFVNAFAQQSGDKRKMNVFITKLMSTMTLEEKLGQLNLELGEPSAAVNAGGAKSNDFSNRVKQGLVGATFGGEFASNKLSQDLAMQSRLKIPLIFGKDIIHGFKTTFPIPLAMSCSWDPDLIKESARIAATESSAEGINWVFSPMVDIARDPRWGRIAEGAGEDPYLGSLIAQAMVKGYQEDLSKPSDVMACVKHFALYGAVEGGRDYNTVDMSHIVMYNDYFPPYKAAVEAGAGSFMSSFNLVDRIPATINKWLLTDVLRHQWAFNGFVVTDFASINEVKTHGVANAGDASAMALKAGTDLDMFSGNFINTLRQALSDGRVTLNDINVACRRMLEAKYKLGLFQNPYKYFDEKRRNTDQLTTQNLNAARRFAQRSMVLLKNDNQLLPLKKSAKIAVIGPLANSKADLMGTWVATKESGNVVSIFEGIKKMASSNSVVTYAKGCNITEDPYLLKYMDGPLSANPSAGLTETKTPDELRKEALQIAANSDVIIAVMGETSGMTGEDGNRSMVNIPETQVDLLKQLLKTGKPVVLVVINGRPLDLTWENENLNAILEAWAPGIQGGNAVADVLFGNYNPSGKLTTSFPRNVGQIPIYYNHLSTGRPYIEGKERYTTSYIDVNNSPLYPFGYGLSYTDFKYSDLAVNKKELHGNEDLIVTTTITNMGKYAGEEVVQLYVQDVLASIARPVKELKCFKKIMLQPGEKKEVNFTVKTSDLMFYNSDLKYTWESGEFNIFVGTNSRDVNSVKVNWNKN